MIVLVVLGNNILFYLIIEKKLIIEKNTFNNGYLGSCIDEERSEMR